ncbi:MAG: RNA polymerase sigma factor [Bacteroidales bacterium]|nr:RNA polymerase sigma factor [Bacteroidales bacterium]
MKSRLRSGDGNEQVFSTVFNLYCDSLYNYGLRITGKGDLVEDCIQEVFYRIWKNQIDLSILSSVKSYLFKALRRQIINILELKAYQTITVEITDNLGIEFSPEDFFIIHQSEEITRSMIVAALNNLPERQREAIYLRFFEELNFNEIAVIMNINPQSAKNSVFRGLDSLKKMFPSIVLILGNTIL